MRKISRVFFAVIILAFLVTHLTMAAGRKEEPVGRWRPTRPITIIVPWMAGGSTDQITRLVAGELEPFLGTRIVVVNQPGASGSVGTRNVLAAPRDGYTWGSGASVDLGVYPIMGLLDTDIRKDWHLFLSVANVMVFSVNPNTPYQTFDDLLRAFRERPGQIPVATAGLSSAGRIAMEVLRKHTGIEYKHVTYDGGRPAVIATVAGETEVTSQMAVEQVEMIRGGKLRPLAVLSDRPLTFTGFTGSIPPITNWVKGYKPGMNYFGIFIPRGVPQEVIATVEMAWNEIIMNSQKVKDFAATTGAIFDPAFGEDAQRKAFDYYQTVAWLYHDAGLTKISPDTVGIPRP